MKLKLKLLIETYWREYYVILRSPFYIQIINNWHEWNMAEWYLFCMLRKYRNGKYEYYLGLLGFQLRIFYHKKHKPKKCKYCDQLLSIGDCYNPDCEINSLPF